MEAIIRILVAGRVSSQARLADMVIRLIREESPGYALSPQRARRIASGSGRIRIRIATRKSRHRMAKCPFCGSELEREEVRDLFGQPTRGSGLCTACRFRIDPGKIGPARYIFELR